MSDRFYLTKQEILNRYGKPIICIGGDWTRSDIYYDKKNDCFIEQCYHEEYLDTGTVCDGCSIISDAYLWDKLVRCCNEEGMRVYLKYREHKPDPFRIGATITMDEFIKGVKVLRQNEPWRCCYCEQIGSIIIIRNESNIILGILGKADNYCFFYDPKSDESRKGFHIWEEALAYALKSITFYHDAIVERDQACKQTPSVIVEPSPSEPASTQRGVYKKKNFNIYILIFGIVMLVVGIIAQQYLITVLFGLIPSVISIFLILLDKDK